MSSRRSNQSIVRPIATAALTFQLLVTLAMPLAICCCLEMTAEATAASGHEPEENACPHHNLISPAARDARSSDTGCASFDAFVTVLAKLIGISDTDLGFNQSLTALAVVSPLTVDPVDMILPVESPPPRA